MGLSMKKVIAVGVAMLATSLPACATSYSAKPITAKVLDSETGEPLEGANVVAHWIMMGPRSGRGQGDLELMETVTDKNGEFRFPAWGPKAIPSDTAPGTRLTNQDPAIILFKSGYKWNAISNDSHSTMLRTPDDLGAPVRDSQWDGKTIQLQKFKGDLNRSTEMSTGVLTGVDYGDCNWKKIPRIIVALNKESDRLRREKIVNYTTVSPSIDVLVANEANHKCGPVLEFFKGYMK